MEIALKIEGFVKIFDPRTREIILEKKNSIHYENMSVALANTLSNRRQGSIYQMAFGNGGSSIDATGIITYLPPNTTGQSAGLYNQTYAKIVDDTNVLNSDPTNNRLIVSHTPGTVYTDILVSCLLDYGEPSGQAAFDNATTLEGNYVFDEIGLLADYGINQAGQQNTQLLTHVIFHPVQKSLNRQIQIDYTVRIQSLSTNITI